VGVVLAGGVGSRLGLGRPKQLATVGGRPIIEHTLAAFDAAEVIDEIIVLMAPNHVADVEAIVAAGGFGKVIGVFEGGRTRNHTTQLALDRLGTDECNVLLHDAVRPLVTEQILRDCVAALGRFDAVVAAIPSADTIVLLDDSGAVVDVPDRGRLRRVQTPQGFTLSTIRRAYELAWQDENFAATDDCSVVLRYLPDVAIHVIDGSEHNFKVTTPVDLYVAERILAVDGPG
jgi:ribitol-5-phosphate 2-dehydrogenase (NADP+) / D-ribitol-5-phosphate cytidylyltransferase